ncbi:DUF998 domain-containing protein [Lactobacillaceae bacterium L1_55_11]|nr:DUF998 domain-containing protein [Lactobacillaceae bacterium L1_55_11]
MADGTYHITIPDQVSQDLDLKDGETLILTAKGRSFSVQPDQPVNERQTFSIRRFLLPSLLATLAFAIYSFFNHGALIPFTGDNSIATAIIILGEIVGVPGFVFTYVEQNLTEPTAKQRKIGWRLLPTATIALATIQGFATIGFFWALGYLFQNAAFDTITATILFFMFISIINFLMIYAAFQLSTSFIMALLIVTIVVGVLVSMVTNSNARWWQHNFSFLGTSQAQYAWQFNSTLMISGVLWLALLDYLFVPISRQMPRNWRLIILRTFLILDAVTLACLGAIPNNQGTFHVLHDVIANFLIAFTGIPMLGIQLLLPKAPKEFLTISYVIAGALAITMTLFYIIPYLSLTAFEIIAFALAVSWVLLLMQTIHQLFQNDIQNYTIKVQA